MLMIETTRLYLEVGRGQRICNGLYLGAARGTITAIMGPAGSGKSVFLKLLIGYLRPTSGYVQIAGQRLDAQDEAIRNRVGYVPQAEIMIPELTVGRSLDYRLRLRSGGMRSRDRDRIIRETCASVGFVNVDSLLKKRIGSPESLGKHPSGGERRRINIAHELLSRPDVLFLDEPTSGLSSLEADNLVNQLRELADGGLTIVMTIHQPSQTIFEWLDDLLIVGWGGTLAYYGKAQSATGYFQEITDLQLRPRQNPAEYLLDFVRNPQISAWAVDEFTKHQQQGRAVYLKEEPALDPQPRQEHQPRAADNAAKKDPSQ